MVGARAVIVATLLLVAGQALAQTPAQPVGPTPATGSDFAQLRSVVVGDLRDPRQRRVFDANARKGCGRPIPVVETGRDDSRPVARIVQDPAPGRRVACLGSVTLTYYPARPETPPDPPVVAQPPPLVWRMPRLRTVDDEARLESEYAERCYGRQLRFDRREDYDRRSAGSLISQRPERGVEIGCGLDVTVVRSKGPPPASPFRVGRLDTAARQGAFEDQAQRFCGTPYRLKFDSRPDGRALGSYLDQSVAPETLFACGLAVTVTLAAEPPVQAPWRMPDFRQAGAERSLQRTANERCGAFLPIEREPAARDRTTRLITQLPPAGTEIDCDTAVRLAYQQREVVVTTPPTTPTPPAPPAADMPEVPTTTTEPTAATDTVPPGASETVVPAEAALPKGSGPATKTVTTRTRTVSTPAAMPWWLLAAGGAAIVAVVAGVAAYVLRPVPIPTIEIGTPTAGGAPPPEGVAGVLPVTALEALRGSVTVIAPLQLPVEKLEIDDG